MTQTTRHNYEKRIKQLEADNERLMDYKRVALSIFDMTTNLIGEGKQISHAWILQRFREVMK